MSDTAPRFIDDFDTDLEVWENRVPGRQSIWRPETQHPAGVASELIGAHARFTISYSERRYNQVKYLNEKDDPFLNGMFRPVSIPASSPDHAKFAGRAEHASDADVVKLFKSALPKFKAHIEACTNPVLLRRYLSMRDRDLPAQRLDLVQARLEELQPRSAELKPAEGVPEPVAPRAGVPAPTMHDYYGMTTTPGTAATGSR